MPLLKYDFGEFLFTIFAGVKVESYSASAESNSSLSLVMVLVIVLAVVVGILLVVLGYFIWRKKLFKKGNCSLVQLFQPCHVLWKKLCHPECLSSDLLTLFSHKLLFFSKKDIEHDRNCFELGKISPNFRFDLNPRPLVICNGCSNR